MRLGAGGCFPGPSLRGPPRVSAARVNTPLRLDLVTTAAAAGEGRTVVHRDPESDEQLVRRHQRDVWRFLRWLGADRALADDLLQETFVRLLRRRRDEGTLPTDDRAMRAWLATTARNLFANARRRARAGVPLDDDATLVAVFERDIASRDERIDALNECLAALPERSRAALDLHYRDRLDHRRLGAAFGLRAAGVKAMLRRLRRALADCIERRMG